MLAEFAVFKRNLDIEDYFYVMMVNSAWLSFCGTVGALSPSES